MTQEDLIKIAKNACKNAYPQLTGYMVGAALLAKSGTVFLTYLFVQKEMLYKMQCHMAKENLKL